jgi:hypothetical protein
MTKTFGDEPGNWKLNKSRTAFLKGRDGGDELSNGRTPTAMSPGGRLGDSIRAATRGQAKTPISGIAESSGG